MKYLTDVILKEGIAEQKRTFDSHDLIVWILQKKPQKYTYELYEYVSKRDPIKTLHSEIGKQIARLKDVVKKCGKVVSRNIRNQKNTCEKWEKC
jgi:hypothetical protein